MLRLMKRGREGIGTVKRKENMDDSAGFKGQPADLWAGSGAVSGTDDAGNPGGGQPDAVSERPCHGTVHQP